METMYDMEFLLKMYEHNNHSIGDYCVIILWFPMKSKRLVCCIKIIDIRNIGDA